jgi:bifunctional oligoribonuclease and PAP phosphatase NrnA
LEEQDITRAQELIKSAQHIVITTHRSPDGDAIGSSLAMLHYLNQLGKSAEVIVPNNYPKFLKWMPGNDEVKIYENDREAGDVLIAKADLIFSLDYNILSRTFDMSDSLEKSSADFILIDHHQNPADYPTVTFSDTTSCSTCQLVYDFIEYSGHLELINDDIAQAIYCGIMTDSGSFRFSSVNDRTHLIAGRLIASGLDHAYIHGQVYDTNVLDRLKLVGHALSNKLEIIDGSHTALIYLDRSELETYNYRPGDTEGLVNYALSMEGINLAAFIREGNNEVKMSFRSKGHFDVNQFARTYFNGGGHINAAGASSGASLEDVISKFKSAVSQHSQELNFG